jgi:hypothetical protein
MPIDKRNDALKEWFSGQKRPFENWINSNLERTLTKETKIQLKKIAIWLNNADIQKTPTLFWNGQLLPDTYQIADLNTLMYFKNN